MRRVVGGAGRHVLGFLVLVAVAGLTGLGGLGPSAALAAHLPALEGRVTPVTPIPLPADVELRVGETATLDGGRLRLYLVGVVEDDRCPREVMCEWPGRVVLHLRVMLDGEDWGEVPVALYAAPQPPLSLQADAVVTVDQYTIVLVSLEPYPVFGQQTLPAGYLATIRVTAP